MPLTIVRGAQFSALSAAIFLACSASESSRPGIDAGVFDAAVDASSVCTAAYPAGPYGFGAGDVLADFSLTTADGTATSIASLRSCEKLALQPFLLLRIGAPWAGPYRFHRSREPLANAPNAELFARADILLADADNHAPTAESARVLEAEIPVSFPTFADTRRESLAFDTEHRVLPWYVFVDARTMRVLAFEAAPDGDRIRYRMAALVAQHRGEPLPRYPDEPPLVDGMFTQFEWEFLREMRLRTSAITKVPFANDASVTRFGALLYKDTSLSPSNTVSCLGCHDPSIGFGDNRALGTGLSVGSRKSPHVGQSATGRNFFWDGRAPTLAAQALGPFENPKEFGSDRCFVLHRIEASLLAEWPAAFGPFPSLAQVPARCVSPSAAPPEVDAAFAKVGDALAAFEATFQLADAPLDRYLEGESNAFSASEKSGFRIFAHNGCVQCHYGPRLSDDAFHAAGFPDRAGTPDGGRAAVPGALPRGGDAALPGAFKTPALRGIAGDAGFGHAGSYTSLRQVAHHYATGATGVPLASGVPERWIVKFHESDEADLTAFLGTLRAVSK